MRASVNGKSVYVSPCDLTITRGKDAKAESVGNASLMTKLAYLLDASNPYNKTAADSVDEIMVSMTGSMSGEVGKGKESHVFGLYWPIPDVEASVKSDRFIPSKETQRVFEVTRAQIVELCNMVRKANSDLANADSTFVRYHFANVTPVNKWEYTLGERPEGKKTRGKTSASLID